MANEQDRPGWWPRKWNSHDPQEYMKKLASLDDGRLEKECGSMIWLAAYAANNPRSDYHWMCDATYWECSRRDDEEIYVRAYKAQTR